MVDLVSTPSGRRLAGTEPRRSRRRETPERRGAPERRATIEDWLEIPEEKRAELILGRIVYHALPDVKHGDTQAQISRLLYPYRRRRNGGGGGGLGGWWLSQEVDMALADVGCRPDVVGWRCDRHPRLPRPDARGAVIDTPDFLCEVLSPSTARYDQGEKRDAYFRAGVPHYWLVDPERRTLTVLERTDRGYLIVRVAGPGEVVRSVPFEEVEIPVDELFLEEDSEATARESGKASSPEPAQPGSTASARSPRKASERVSKKRAPGHR